MALVLNDRVKETTTTTGTGTLTLAGAVTGFETFAAGIGNSNTTYYAIVLPGTSEFEVGLGTLNSDSSTLARTPISSSNSDSAVNFSAGTKTIFCTIPASKSVFLDASGNTTLGADLSVGDDLTVNGGVIELRSNSGAVGQLKLYCEVSNNHAQTISPQAHGQSATNTLTLPGGSTIGNADATLVSDTGTQTLTNKTIDASQLSGTVANARLDAELQALAGLTSAADKGIQFTGSGTASTYDLTTAGKALLDDADAAAQRTTLGLGTAAVAATGISNGNVPVFTSGVADDDFLRVNSTSIEGRSASEVLSDIGGQASLTFGISNTNAVKIDSASVADDEFARFTANGLESRSASEVLSDIGATTATAAADEATALAIALG
tara:strand:+ start:718 stop:1857 length:1140 start_codon:yes stop_codon:yes gene_type:complete